MKPDESKTYQKFARLMVDFRARRWAQKDAAQLPAVSFISRDDFLD